MEVKENAKHNKQHFDVIISGGGLTGSLMALSLLSIENKSHPLSIAIIEAASVNSSKTDAATKTTQSVFDERVLALSDASVEYFKTLNIWSLIKNHAQPITDIHISDRGYYGKARISAKDHITSVDHCIPAVGYVIEMSKLGSAIQQSLNELEKSNSYTNLTWFTPDSIEAIQWQSESVEVTLASKIQLSGSLLIGCDGVNSVCRQSANIKCDISNYDQSALITNVSTTLPHQGVAYERFTENGPIAMLPMVNLGKVSRRCSLVWTLTPEQAQSYKELADDEFKVLLEKSFGSWLGGIEQIGTRHVYPLSLVRAQEQIYHRMVLIGNASHTIHPIAGQGFNLGLRDVQTLTQLIKSILLEQGDIGAFYRLSEYARLRKTDHSHIINLTDSLVTLFSNDLFPLVVGRNVGLKVLNYVPALKSAFVNKAMGY